LVLVDTLKKLIFEFFSRFPNNKKMEKNAKKTSKKIKIKKLMENPKNYL
jgi:hypothetical protein